MDEIDHKAVETLMRQGRITWADLAGILGLSAPAAADRVRQLESKGVIQQYAAIIDPDSVGCHLTAFISVTLEHPRNRASFLEAVQAMREVQECHHVAGEDDYLLKVRCSGTRHLDELLAALKSVPGVIRTRTIIVLSTVKETPAVPLLNDLREQSTKAR